MFLHLEVLKLRLELFFYKLHVTQLAESQEFLDGVRTPYFSDVFIAR